MMDGLFAQLAAPWVAHGANVLPIAPGAKSPDVAGWGKPRGADTSPALHSPDSPKVPASVHPRHRDLNCAVLPGALSATVVDVDDLSMLPQVLAVCGDTAFRTISGRVGGGVHLWYRGPSASRNGICPGVDIKSTGGYVIAPGSIHHKTGKPYMASPALSAWMVDGVWGVAAWPVMRADWRERLAECRPRMTAPTRIDLGMLADQLKSRGKDRTVVPMLRAVAAGRPFAEAGLRDSGLYHCLRTLADAWPYATSDAMCNLFAPSALVMERDADVEIPILEAVASKWHRLAGGAVDDEAARAAKEAAQEAAALERARALRARAHRWVGSDSDVVCVGDVSANALPILLHYGRSYYLRVGAGWVGPWSKDDLAPDVLAALSAVYDVEIEDMGGLLGGYGARPARVRSSLAVERTTYNPSLGLLSIAVATRDLTIKAEYSHAVAACIAAWGGRYAGQLELWLAGLLRFDIPCRALILSGSGGRGKSLLLAGLSQLWEDGAVKMRKVLGKKFNAAITQSPLAISDDNDGDDDTGAALASFLREAVQDRTQAMERKGVDAEVVRGCMRFAIATNDAFDLISGAVSYMADTAALDAYGDRILHIPVPKEAKGCWDRAGISVDQLVEGQAIARHVLWLAEVGADHAPDDRFWVGEGDPVLAARAVLCSGLRGELLVRVHEGLSGIAPMSASWMLPNVVREHTLVNARALFTAWAEAPRGATPRTVALCLSALARGRKTNERGLQYDGGSRWHVVPNELIAWYVDRSGA